MEKIKEFMFGVLIITLVWLMISNIIQAFKCPTMSQTELFIHLPKSFICDWKECNTLTPNN